MKLDIETVAKDAGNARGANMVLLGMAAPFIEILTVEQLRKAIAVIFARKGEAIVEANLKAFDCGVAASKKWVFTPSAASEKQEKIKENKKKWACL